MLWIKLGLIAALAIGGAIAMHLIAEHWRVQGDVRTHAKLDPIIAADQKLLDDTRARAAQLVLDYQAANDRAIKAEKERDDQRRKDAVALDAAVAAVRAGSVVVVPADVARVRDAASAFANGSGNGASTPVTDPALPVAAQAFDAREWSQYDADAGKAYRSAVEDSTMCRGRYGAALAAQQKAGGNNVNAQ